MKIEYNKLFNCSYIWFNLTKGTGLMFCDSTALVKNSEIPQRLNKYNIGIFHRNRFILEKSFGRGYNYESTNSEREED